MFGRWRQYRFINLNQLVEGVVINLKKDEKMTEDHNVINKPVYTKTEHITVTKTDPSLLIFGGAEFSNEVGQKTSIKYIYTFSSHFYKNVMAYKRAVFHSMHLVL